MVQLTPAEVQALGRLEALGFSRQNALEAFLVCNRNENVAANYLFENQNDFAAPAEPAAAQPANPAPVPEQPNQQPAANADAAAAPDANAAPAAEQPAAAAPAAQEQAADANDQEMADANEDNQMAEDPASGNGDKA